MPHGCVARVEHRREHRRQVALQRAKVSALRVTLKPVAGSGVDPEALFKKGLASLASGDRAGAITNFAAAVKLGEVGSPRVVPGLLRAAKKEKDRSVRELAVLSMFEVTLREISRTAGTGGRVQSRGAR